MIASFSGTITLLSDIIALFSGIITLYSVKQVAYHVPILPSDQSLPSIAHQWWRDKHAKDTNR